MKTPSPPTPPDPPKPLPAPAQPAPPSNITNPNRKGVGGIMSTIMTGPQGDLTPGKTTKKTLLGGN